MQMKIEDAPPLLMFNDAAENTVESGLRSMREHWFNVVEDYSRRNLTDEADKLPALSGLAQISKKLHGPYSKGLFRMDMPSAFLWRIQLAHPSCDIQTRRPKHHRAPTWSWAAVDGAITYES